MTMPAKKTPIPSAVSRHMSKLARKANQSMRGTAMAKKRASKAAKARWANRS